MQLSQPICVDLRDYACWIHRTFNSSDQSSWREKKVLHFRHKSSG